MSKIIGAVEIGTSKAKALIGEVAENGSLNVVGMDSKTAFKDAESEYFKIKLSETPTGILESLLISFTSSKLFSHEKKIKKMKK